IEDVSLVVGVVAAGIGIEGATPDFELECELPGVPALGPLEHHVLEQVGHAHLGARLVGAGGSDPTATRGGRDPGQDLGGDGKAVGCRGIVGPVSSWTVSTRLLLL